MSNPGRITFSHIYDVLRSLGKRKPIVLGRWKLKHDNQLATVVKYANEDHCGACGETVVQMKPAGPTKKEQLLHFEYIHMTTNTPH
tara:strand:+ start:9737 stop:9994 length:258 start_codon:yes stop_codon:yes gene_type:complete